MQACLLVETPDDAERRIADLERQLEQQRRIAELQQQLAQVRSEQQQGSGRPDVDDLLRSLSGFRLDTAGWPPNVGNSPAEAPADSRLSAAPRRIPMRFVLAELLPFRWWYLMAIFLVTVPVIIVWVTEPAFALPIAVTTLALIYTWQLRGTYTRLQLLKWGQVATVTGTEIVSQASYFGGVTWYNTPLPVANGWRVSRPLWSGPSTTTRIRYTLNGYQGELTVKGREYIDGVILADQRRPERARCVTFFAYDLDRDDTGDWVGRLRPRLVMGMLVWLIVVVGWLLIATATTTGYATQLLHRAQLITIDAGSTARISGNSLVREVSCNNGGTLTVSGNKHVVTVSGHCAGLIVDGIGNTVTIEATDTISVSGIDCHVTYHSGKPTVTNNGINNKVVRG